MNFPAYIGLVLMPLCREVPPPFNQAIRSDDKGCLSIRNDGAMRFAAARSFFGVLSRPSDRSSNLRPIFDRKIEDYYQGKHLDNAERRPDRSIFIAV
ncbi:hypothetical protein HNR00_000460 [Methylorubrum rhodinum]|uniref:Uncharacterized protein n=1 Tax=Methylorubrum rhodinum TaxID=29428 RepID=A0A840ZFH5_9HYPH|nr:hypothetical protein [Methylorubrum rhodinum]MBB5755771.1 hypothetical protein [Methylorubrum rhodinum]